VAAKHAEAGGRTEAAKPDQAVATDTNQRPIGTLAELASPGKLNRVRGERAATGQGRSLAIVLEVAGNSRIKI
jgi:hypothetical protein